VTTFHVELELPLLDATRRQFLMFRNYESLMEMLPPPEDEEWTEKLPSTHESVIGTKLQIINVISSICISYIKSLSLSAY
jgi:hypothetical protein